MKKFVFDALFNTPETIAKIRAGINEHDLVEIGKDLVYRKIMLDIREIENAIPSTDWHNHTTVTMMSGDSFVLKISNINLFRLIDHVDAGKLICKLLN